MVIFSCKQKAPEIEWQKSYGGAGKDVAFSIEQTKDSGYIVAGYTTSFEGDLKNNHGCDDYWILKLDSHGNIQWQKLFGGDYFDEAYEIHQTTDGGYIVDGVTYSFDGDAKGNHGISDILIFKLDSTGSVVWKKIFGSEKRDYSHYIAQTKDGGYLIFGSQQISEVEPDGERGNSDVLILKIDRSGNVQWKKNYGGSGIEGSDLFELTQDGNIIFACQTTSNDGNVGANHGKSDIWIFKLDSSGNMLWKKLYGGSEHENAAGICATEDGGYMISGATASNDGDIKGNHGSTDAFLIKLDSIGELQWQHCYGGLLDDKAFSMTKSHDSSFVVAGETSSIEGDVKGNHGLSDVWIFKVDAKGKLIWQKTLGGSKNDILNCVRQTIDGGYILAGATDSNDGDVTKNNGGGDMWIVKLKPDQ